MQMKVSNKNINNTENKIMKIIQSLAETNSENNKIRHLKT